MPFQPKSLILIWSAILTVAVPCFAVPVLRVDRAQTKIAVAHGAKRKWSQGEYLCVRKFEKDIACGPVSKATSKGAIVTFDYQTGDEIASGDEVVFKRGASTSGKVSEPSPSVAERKIRKEKFEETVESDLKSLTEDAPIPAEKPVSRLDINPPIDEEPVKRRVKHSRVREEDEEAEVDLSEMEEKPEEPTVASVHGQKLSAKPKFKALFDWLITHQPGRTEGASFSFNALHYLLLMEIMPDPRIYFGFEVHPTNPRYFELDWQFSKKLTLRAGRIYIPFDDLSPHTYFGGRANITQLSQPGNGSTFLPNLFADLGVGIKAMVVQNADTEIELHAYVVNGFQDGGVSPDNESVYPNFNDLPLGPDNNSAKSVGGRAQISLMRELLGFGASIYYGRYSQNDDPEASLLMLGADGRLRFFGTEIRGGYAYMNAGVVSIDPATSLVISTDSFVKGGFYLEFAQWFGKWRALARMGQSQNDSRTFQFTDQTVVGAALQYRGGPIGFSLEHSRDLNELPGKTYLSYTGFRVSVML